MAANAKSAGKAADCCRARQLLSAQVPCPPRRAETSRGLAVVPTRPTYFLGSIRPVSLWPMVRPFLAGLRLWKLTMYCTASSMSDVR